MGREQYEIWKYEIWMRGREVFLGLTTRVRERWETGLAREAMN